MSDIRQRKLQEANYSKGAKRFNTRQKPPSKLPKVFISLAVISLLVLLGLYTSVLNPITDRIANTLGYRKPVYAVIIDAGSTGSRVLAYTFHKSEGGQLILDDELFEEIKPGLSAYAKAPLNGAESIIKLMTKANTVVPKKYRSSTPVVLRATAGLRLLDPSDADLLISSVRVALQETGYKMADDAVEIMDGQDEGINSWFTVNFLQERLDNVTTAALDLGGGSTQVTYEPPLAVHSYPLVSVPGNSKIISLFTYSYLNLGLMAARHGSLLQASSKKTLEDSMESICISPSAKNIEWKYTNKKFLVSGYQKSKVYKETKDSNGQVTKTAVVDMGECRAMVSLLVANLLKSAPIPTHLGEQHINAFSYYWDRAVEAGLIDPAVGGKVTVMDFVNAAETACKSTDNSFKPWACFDLIYISILLNEGFRLPLSTELELVKKINGHEISWALGLAYNTLIKS